MSKHTPGQWYITPDSKRITWQVDARDAEQHIEGIAHVYAKGESVWNERQQMTGYSKPEEAEANARLIAAAPELLAAHEAIAKIAHLAWTNPPTIKAAFQRIEELSRAAIAKAEGGAA